MSEPATGESRVFRAAASLRLSQRRAALRVDPLSLQYPFAVRFDTFGNFCKNSRQTRGDFEQSHRFDDGCTIIMEQSDLCRYVVLYNERVKNVPRRAFTLAHEIGHILLRHRQDDDAQEREADLFAAELLAPRILVWKMAQAAPQTPFPGDLMQIFGLSRRAAEHRLALCGKAAPAFLPEELELLRRLACLLPGNAPAITI